MDKRLIWESAALQAANEYQKALHAHNLRSTYKPPENLCGRCSAVISRGRMTNIVLLPGFNSAGSEWRLFREALKPMGHMVVQAQVDVRLGNEDLTDNLYHWLYAQGLLKKSAPLTLIGFSNGGLIGRRLLQKYCVMNIRKLIMIATPNWGTSLAVYGQWFLNHPGLLDLATGSTFLNNLNKDFQAGKDVYYHVIVGDAARDLEGKRNDGVVWEDSATLGYTLPYVRVDSGEPKIIYPPNSAWHLNLICKARRHFGPSNDKAWPITLRYIRRFLAE